MPKQEHNWEEKLKELGQEIDGDLSKLWLARVIPFIENLIESLELQHSKELKQAVEDYKEGLRVEVLKIIDDNDPQTDNKVSPKYWGKTLREDILSLLSK